MRAKIVDVALAAMMACGLGGVQRAEAAFFKVQGFGVTGNNDYFTLNEVFDTQRGFVQGTALYEFNPYNYTDEGPHYSTGLQDK